jgi:hypothetical protein
MQQRLPTNAATLISASLPMDRSFCGALEVFDKDGASLLAGIEVAGRASSDLAKGGGNPDRNSIFLYGDTPCGVYAVEVAPHLTIDDCGPNGMCLLRPVNGDAALADANGRFHNAIHGGALGWNGCLRSTSGTLRVSDADQARLLRVLASCAHPIYCLVADGAEPGRPVEDAPQQSAADPIMFEQGPGVTERERGELITRRGALAQSAMLALATTAMFAGEFETKEVARADSGDEQYLPTPEPSGPPSTPEPIITPGTPQPLPTDTIPEGNVTVPPPPPAPSAQPVETPTPEPAPETPAPETPTPEPPETPTPETPAPLPTPGTPEPFTIEQSQPHPVQGLPAKVQPTAAESIALVNNAINDNFAANKNACNKFVEAVASALGDHTFPSDANADRILQILRSPGGPPSPWVAVADGANAGAEASQMASQGMLVVGGLSSLELHDTNGHVIIVESGPMVPSRDGHQYPVASWGTLSLTDPSKTGKIHSSVNYAFGVADRQRVHYYYRPLPAQSP